MSLKLEPIIGRGSTIPRRRAWSVRNFYIGGDSMKRYPITEAMDAVRYILGGNSTFTLKSLKTNNHLTFEVYRHKEKDHLHFVWAKLGAKTNYLGTIFDGKTFRKTYNSNTRKELHFNGFSWFWEKVTTASTIPSSMEFYHHGHCGICGRLLTTPDSIKRGIGPVCDNRLSM